MCSSPKIRYKKIKSTDIPSNKLKQGTTDLLCMESEQPP